MCDLKSMATIFFWLKRRAFELIKSEVKCIEKNIFWLIEISGDERRTSFRNMPRGSILRIRMRQNLVYGSVWIYRSILDIRRLYRKAQKISTVSPLLYRLAKYSKLVRKCPIFFNLRDGNLRPCPGRSFTLPNILSSSVPKISNYDKIIHIWRYQISTEKFLKNYFFWVKYYGLD